MKELNFQELVERRDQLFKTYMKIENKCKKNRLSLRIKTLTKKIEAAKPVMMIEETARLTLQNSVMNAKLWRAGLCSSPCSDDSRKMGACTCYNIGIEKSLELKMEI